MKTTTTDKELPPAYINIQGLKDYADIGVEWQKKLREAKAIPYLKVGKRIIYKLSDIDTWMDSHAINVEGK